MFNRPGMPILSVIATDDNVLTIDNTSTNNKTYKWNLASALIFMLGSCGSCISAIEIAIDDVSMNNIGLSFGYVVYSLAYMIYLYAEFRKNKRNYIYSTIFFIIGSLVFVITGIYDTYTREDYSLSNMSTNISNLAWLIGYLFSYKAELLAPARTNLDILSVPFLQP